MQENIGKVKQEQLSEGFTPCYSTGASDKCGQDRCSYRAHCIRIDDHHKQQRDYLFALFGHIDDPVTRILATEKALNTALDIRKFEIQLYWERTKYFWVFLASIFAGFFWTLQQDMPSEKIDNIMFILTCMGLASSCAWFFVLRGSKYWQENWERHVDYLEKEINGKLYCHVITGKLDGNTNILNSYPYSVSKINMLLSIFVVLFWCFAFIGELYYLFYTTRFETTSFASFYIRNIAILITEAFVLLLFFDCKTKYAEKIMNEKSRPFISRHELEILTNKKLQGP